MEPSLEHPVPVLTAPSQLVEMPKLTVAPAVAMTLVSTVPKLVWVRRKTSSVHLFTTLSDWAWAAAARAATERANMVIEKNVRCDEVLCTE